MRALSKENNGIKFLFLVIDIFNKYGWIKPLKDKQSQTVANALKEIFKESGRRPKKLWTDKGREFFNKDIMDLVELYATETEIKSSVVERWIRTMKNNMFKYFTDNKTSRYIDILPDLVEDYNNTVHSSTKLTPTEASEEENEFKLWRNLYPDRYKKSRLNPKFSVGDEVRISRKKAVFEKGHTTRWTNEIFTIKEIRETNPITYKLEDLEGKEIKRSFYAEELQKTKEQIYKIEKIIKKENGRSFVKWEGYDDKFNSWVANKNIKDLNQIKNDVTS